MKGKLGLLTTMLILAGWANASEQFRIYTEQYPPYNMTTNGQPFAHSESEITGLCTDVLKALLGYARVDYSIKLRDLSYGMNRAQKHRNHGIYCISKTDERAPFFEWLGPLTTIKWTLFAKPGSSLRLESLEDAREYLIGGYKGDVMAEYLEDKGFNVSAITNNGLNAKRLVQEQIDLWVADGLAGPHMATDAAGVTGLEAVLVFRETPMYLAINKDSDPDLIKDLNAAYQTMLESGEIDTISHSYGL